MGEQEHLFIDEFDGDGVVGFEHHDRSPHSMPRLVRLLLTSFVELATGAHFGPKDDQKLFALGSQKFPQKFALTVHRINSILRHAIWYIRLPLKLVEPHLPLSRTSH